MAEKKGPLGFTVGPVRRWFTEEQCESVVSSIGPTAGGVGLGLAGFTFKFLPALPFGGAFFMAGLGAGTGGLGARKILERR